MQIPWQMPNSTRNSRLGGVRWCLMSLPVVTQVPIQVHVVDSTPKSAAQKLQRFQRAKQLGSVPVKANGHAHAGLIIKDEVLNAWEEELGSCPVETDNFFSSGGDSMQAETLACTLSSRLGFPVDSALIYGSPEPARLAAALQEQISRTASQVYLSPTALTVLWHAQCNCSYADQIAWGLLCPPPPPPPIFSVQSPALATLQPLALCRGSAAADSKQTAFITLPKALLCSCLKA